ncbi:hypothetical protein ACVWXQ_008199 [Bradyrhizobium sp. S3.14.4]
MMFIQNLRIGTKLAVTSALTIALVALMIVLQMNGDAAVQKLSNGASGAAVDRAKRRGSQSVGPRDADRHS